MEKYSKDLKMIWLIEEYDDYVKELVEEIENQGHQVDFVNYYKMQQDANYTGVGMPKGCGNWPAEENVLFYGSIQTADWVSKNRPWIPGVWYTKENYKCSTYYAYLGKHLLNQEYMFLPRAEVKRCSEKLFEANGGSLFIRPDAGAKSFGGKAFHQETFEKDWGWVEQFTEPTSLCVVSDPKNIEEEWRFIVAGEDVLTGSQYKVKGSAEIVAHYPLGALWKCREVLTDAIAVGFTPDPMYTIDICRTADGEFHLLEINCFCCSGLYACNLEAIVARASLIAKQEHKEYDKPIL